MSTSAALDAMRSSAAGLDGAEAAKRLRTHGPNTVAREAQQGVLRRFASTLATPLSLTLLALAVVNFYTGQPWGALVIVLMVVLSSLLSFVQQYRSSKAVLRLRAMVSTTVTVIRDSRHVEIALAQLVPGDIVALSVGTLIPADLRILSCKDLFINQASLTGESLPVEKNAAPASVSAKSALELGNIAFMGSHVVSGIATALVVATGSATAFGALAADIAGQRVPTRFDRGIRQFIAMMLRVMLVMVPLVFLINGISKGDWLEALLFAVAVAVGLTPEMLPMIVTINQAKGALAMAKKKVIVKRLNAIQNFGAMDILCTDKTGTLTQDKVILEKHVDISGEDSEKVTEYAYLNSFHQTGLKNLLDVAILKYVDVHEKLRADTEFTKVDEIPFDFQRRRMSVIVRRADGARLLICKGAVEEVLAVCTRAEHGAQTIDLLEHHGQSLGKTVQELNCDGFRVIAIACKQLPTEPEAAFCPADESMLTLVGYIAFFDPPKDSAFDAVKALGRHGVTIKVLTGDNDAVAANVCRHVGLASEHVLLGSDVDAMNDEQLSAQAETATIFAKMAPQQKARVIRALQGKGHVVGYLGDGINDGPALKAADIGISVDGAVDIAKESADIILLKKNLMALKEGVVEGRRVFGNITKYLKMSASSNFGNMLSVLGASSFLPFLPMAPAQILLNNLLYDVSQTTVATDHVDHPYLMQARRWEIRNIGRFMLCLGPVSSLFDYLTFALLWFYCGGAHNAALFQTGWFLESLLSQTMVVHVIRTGKLPFIQSKPSTPLLVTTCAICLLGLWLPGSPFAPALGFGTLPPLFWLALPVILAGYLLLAQWVKSWLIRRFGWN